MFEKLEDIYQEEKLRMESFDSIEKFKSYFGITQINLLSDYDWNIDCIENKEESGYITETDEDDNIFSGRIFKGEFTAEELLKEFKRYQIEFRMIKSLQKIIRENY